MNKLMIKEEKKADIKNQFSMELVVKNVKDSSSVIVAFFKQKDAADYLWMTEDAFDRFTKAVNMKYAVLHPDGEIIYSIDELDKWGIILEETFIEIEEQVKDKSE